MSEREPARRRLAFDELFRLQLALVLRQDRLQRDARGIRHVVARATTAPRPWWTGSSTACPSTPTAAQHRAIAAIRDDLAGPLPMHRLLQGDVGSGKTVVAVAALLVAVEGGHQGALMAPTEVLAEQHATAVRQPARRPAACPIPRRSRAGARSGWRSSPTRRPPPSGPTLHAGLADGTVDLLIGTHALLTDQVGFRSLGVVVIDEQHRFGVEQRAALRAKGRGADGSGRDPDLLVMTATPIPRTAAMVVFGDLDMTIIDELPPGRLPVDHQLAADPARGRGGLVAGADRGGRRQPGLRGVPAGRGVGPGPGHVGGGRGASVWPAPSWPGCGSGSSTASCRRPRRSGSWPSSGPAASTCWWPPR